MFCLCEGNDVGFGVVVEEVLKVLKGGGVHASRVKCEGCDGGVRVGQWSWCVFGGVSGCF